MVATLAKPGRELAKQLLLIEVSVVIFLAVGLSITINTDWGLAALIGGGIFVIANAVFSVCAFLFSGARATKLVAASFYAGEALKILITVLLFSLVYMYMQVELVPLKLAYLLVLGVNIFAPVFFINNRK
ncbi:ATP F0F1 synthase subunit I [Vibrio sp. 10N.286.49.B3]|uniref:F0F1 ATP synthase subunit I n=1 Tax=Vibrio sp. 10N.286.49.B3 TaxID=1880855 RepID=UPI000C81586F|nr:F0F1 ATP synthase subunit I [Vibrio sp. 10N.286.49.B3]PMH45411.1 ATP F0F1 synthase subunit I [Vibrio sp. 10N.286.49.B3]